MAHLQWEDTFRPCNCEDSIHSEKLPFHQIPLIPKLEVASSYSLRIAKCDLQIRNFDILSNDAMTSTLKTTYIRISR